MAILSGPGLLYTLRLHWKKSTAGAIVFVAGGYYGIDRFRAHLIRRSYCQRAKVYSEELLSHPTDNNRRMMVFLNPAVDRGNPRKLFQKNVAPILHMAGIDVTVVESEYEGHLRTLMGYMDKGLSGIVIAGGDGSIQEAVTGLLRRTDESSIASVPIGIVPMGKSNSLAGKLFRSEASDVRRLCDAAFSIVAGQTQPLDVMSLKSENKSQPAVFSVGLLQWGLFRDTDRTLDKFWWTGRFRGFSAYLWRTIKGPWPHQRHISVTVPETQAQQSADQPGAASTVAADLRQGVDTAALQVCTPLASDDKLDQITMKIWPANVNKNSFIGYGWRKHVLRQPTEDLPTAFELTGTEFQLNLPEDEVSWFSIDGEMYEAQSVKITLLPKKLKIFVPER
ncbi:acylglycerol kinase, mitochondrial-like [Sycon ciliatum]|uniref:acylglycerol kinase, mitochondrial-like n=1 Tax=Sycon ciliatum TaxID=27933 RepID=UPI0031F662DA